MLSILPMPPWMYGALPLNEPPPARACSVCKSGACKSGAGACGIGMSHTTGCTAGADDTAGDATEVTPAAAPATIAAAAMPVTRVFRVTVVLSIGPTHQRG